MNLIKTAIHDVCIIEPNYFSDSRGYFCETFKNNWFQETVQKTIFIQDNESLSSKHTFRGMHYQIPPFTQSKLVRVPHGSVIDIVVDIRKDSPTFKQLVQVEISDKNRRQLWVPKGCAHGFLVTSDTALFQYKVDNVYSRNHERSFSALDPELGITFPDSISLSEKDNLAPLLKNAWIFESSKGLYEP